MKFNITVIDVSNPETVPTGRGSYQKIEVSYKKDNKVEGKALMSFVNPEVFKQVQTWKKGEEHTVTAEKDAKGYWQWQSVESGSGSSESPVEQKKEFKPNYETKEERILNQKYTIRQNALTNAVKFHSYAGGKGSAVVSPENVIKTALFFASWVETAGTPPIEELKDDITN